jgi:hypothetical protein
MGFIESIGDLILLILDEIKFWGEVISAFLGYDEQAQNQWVERQMRAFSNLTNETKNT